MTIFKYEDLEQVFITIICSGQIEIKLYQTDDKWLYAITHIGTDFGEKACYLFQGEFDHFKIDILCYSDADRKTGIIRIASRIDLFGIESNSNGAVSASFSPGPKRTPKLCLYKNIIKLVNI